MKFSQLLGVILCVVAVGLMLPVKDIIAPSKPLDPSLYAIQSQVKTALAGPNASQDAELLEGVLRAAANCFVLDEQRPSPYYKTGDDLKWAIRSIGDLSYPLGWKMKDRYPNLPQVLSSYMQEKLGDEVSKEALIREMRNLADVLATV